MVFEGGVFLLEDGRWLASLCSKDPSRLMVGVVLPNIRNPFGTIIISIIILDQNPHGATLL